MLPVRKRKAAGEVIYINIKNSYRKDKKARWIIWKTAVITRIELKGLILIERILKVRLKEIL